jgi:hypothetical protein
MLLRRFPAAVITPDSACIWTDGRYTLQASNPIALDLYIVYYHRCSFYELAYEALNHAHKLYSVYESIEAIVY